MNAYLVSVRKEVLELWRTARLLVAGAVLVGFGLLSPLLARYTPELLAMLPEAEQFASLIPPPTVADAVAQYLENIGQFGILLALLLTMGSVAQEKDRGTAAMVLTKPLPRWAFLAAKFTALALLFALCLALAGLGAWYYTLLLFQALDLGAWLALNGLLLVQILVYVALTLLGSALFRSQAAAGGLAFGLLLVLGLLGSIPSLAEYMPGALAAWGGALATGRDFSAWPALWLSLGLIALALAGAWLIFQRQEL
jgi:ABC-2 type transport system permease protein